MSDTNRFSSALDELLRHVAQFRFTGAASLHLHCNQGGVTALKISIEHIEDFVPNKGPSSIHAALDETLRRLREKRTTGKCTLRTHWNEGGLRGMQIITEENFKPLREDN